MRARLDVMRHVYLKLKLTQHVTNNDLNRIHGKRLPDAVPGSGAERQIGMRVHLLDFLRQKSVGIVNKWIFPVLGIVV